MSVTKEDLEKCLKKDLIDKVLEIQSTLEQISVGPEQIVVFTHHYEQIQAKANSVEKMRKYLDESADILKTSLDTINTLAKTIEVMQTKNNN